MQSDSRFEEVVVQVFMAGKHGGDRPNTHPLNEAVPIDGFIELRYPREDEPFDPETDGQYWRLSWPFRDHREDGLWFARPDGEKWERSPVWEWENPEEPVENITLSPSYGMKNDDGSWHIHCYIRDGEVELL